MPITEGRQSPHGGGLALRKRLDGGYTVSSGSVVAQVVPDSFRFLTDFIPLLRQEWSGIALRFGRAFFDEWRLTRHWDMDAISPFEKVRTSTRSRQQRKSRVRAETSS